MTTPAGGPIGLRTLDLSTLRPAGRVDTPAAERKRWAAVAADFFTLRLVREPVPGVPYDAGRVRVRSPREVSELMAPLAAVEVAETFWVLPLDGSYRCTAPIVVTRGIVNSTLVHPREVFRAAITAGAAAVILCHNHPSGDPTPSADDRAVTEQLQAAGRLLDIPVHDHVIIGAGRYASFAEAGLL